MIYLKLVTIEEYNYKVSSYFFASLSFVSSLFSSALIVNPISFFFLADQA